MQNHIHTQRRAIARADLLAAAILLFILSLGLFLVPPSHAQALPVATAPADLALAAPAAPVAETLLPFILPGWATTALSIYATVSLAYQALIAWAHKRAAETADVADNQWIASLEAKAWFRILDRFFYWGGYLGSRMGGKKL